MRKKGLYRAGPVDLFAILGTVMRKIVVGLLTSAALLAAGGASSAGAACVDVSAAYPGDDAAPEAIAAWMAGGSARAGMPGELPVMAALVESGLKNLPGGDADSVGYFQMRSSIWDSGKYEGYATNPALQLQWFVDEAKPREKGRGADETQWGEWIADTERPAAQYRGRYQPRLPEARALIAPGCAEATTPPGQQPGTGAPVDLTPPRVTVGGKARQRVSRERAVLLAAGCPAEACRMITRMRVVGSTLRRPVTSSVRPHGVMAGQRRQLRLAVNAALRSAAVRAASRGKPLTATVTVKANDDAGNVSTAKLVVRLS